MLVIGNTKYIIAKENVIKGLFYVRKFMHKDVEDELANNEKSIFEAVFIDPTEYHDKANVFLIVTLDEAEHRRHFFEPEYRTETDELKENFQAVRLIQQYLIEEAQNLNVRVIHNDTDLKDVLKKFELN